MSTTDVKLEVEEVFEATVEGLSRAKTWWPTAMTGGIVAIVQ